jgi:hypothetical protein
VSKVALDEVVVDLNTVPSETLRHLLHFALERERRDREKREKAVARANELLTLPTIAYYRRRRAMNAPAVGS